MQFTRQSKWQLIELILLLSFSMLVQADMLYVANMHSSTVSVIDTNTNQVVTTIPVGNLPRDVVINPSGTRAYVANSVSGTVSVIDTNTNHVMATVPIGKYLSSIAVSPNGKLVYVTDSNYSSSGSGSISVIDTSSNTVVATITGDKRLVDIAVNPSGTRIYTTGISGLQVIDASNYQVIATIPLGIIPYKIAMNSDGTRLYVANQSSVSVVNTSRHSVVATVNAGSMLSDIVISPDGSRVYVGSRSSDVVKGGSSVTVIDTSNNSVTAMARVGGDLGGMAINSIGTFAYITNRNNVMVIDTRTNTIVAQIPVGDFPLSIALRPISGSTQQINEKCKSDPASCGGVTASTTIKIDGVSTRGFVSSTNKMIAGILITGGTKRMMVRATSLSYEEVDLFVEVYTYPDRKLLESNDSWVNSPTAEELMLENLTPTVADAATIINLPTGLFTVEVSSKNGSGGAAIIELYDMAALSSNYMNIGDTTKIGGISTNGFISPTNKMTTGVFISGGTKRTMVRVSSVDGTVDPQVEIYTFPDRRLLERNDSWATSSAAAELTQKKLAPAHATDAATIINLPSGLFTMEVSSKNGGSGANVIEVYDIAIFP